MDALQLPEVPKRRPLARDLRPELTYLTTQAPTGRRTQETALTAIASAFGHSLDSMPWEALRFQHVQALRQLLAQRYAPSTANRMLSALKGTLKQAWLLGYIDQDAYSRIREVKSITFDQPPAGRELTQGEVNALLEACKDGTPAGTRDGAIISLLYLGGLRRSEPCALNLSDVALDVRTVKVQGKRRTVRKVEVLDGAYDWLQKWLGVRGGAPGPLFFQTRARDGSLLPKRMSDKAVRRLWSRRAKRAGLRNTTPHDARRSLATHLLRKNVDLLQVAQIGGWKNLTNLGRYDRRGDEERRQALGRLHIVGPN